MKKIPLIPETFRLTPENSEKLEAIKRATGETKNSIINRLIKSAYLFKRASENENKSD